MSQQKGCAKTNLTSKVKQGVHFHEVVLNGCATDDDPHCDWDLPQALNQLHFGVLDFVALSAAIQIVSP